MCQKSKLWSAAKSSTYLTVIKAEGTTGSWTKPSNSTVFQHSCFCSRLLKSPPPPSRIKSVPALAIAANLIFVLSAVNGETVATLVQPSAVATNATTSATNGSANHINAAPSNACLCGQNVDFIGSDLISVRENIPGSCCYQCKRYFACAAYTWTDYQGGTCWLKIYIGATGCVIGSDENEQNYGQIQDCDLSGNDMWFVRSSLANFGNCESYCWQHPFCRGVTWTNYEGGTCWYKQAVGNCANYPGAVSSVMFSDYTL